MRIADIYIISDDENNTLPISALINSSLGGHKILTDSDTFKSSLSRYHVEIDGIGENEPFKMTGVPPDTLEYINISSHPFDDLEPGVSNTLEIKRDCIISPNYTVIAFQLVQYQQILM